MYDIDSDEDSDENMSFEVFNYKEVPSGCVINAVCRNDLDEVRNLIKEGKSINAKNNAGYTPIHAAVKIQNMEILQFLLQQPEVDINAQTNLGETPLLLSTKSSSSAFALTLLAHGADVNIPNLVMETPLHVSVKKFHDVSLELIKKGADVNAQDFEMYTPLCQAVMSSDFEMVSMLVYYGASADVVDFKGLSPFMKSLYVRNVEIQELLLDLEVDYNRIADSNLSTLLIAFKCRSPLCSELIDRGADVNYIYPTYNPVQFSYHSDKIFKKVWDKFDVQKAYTSEDTSPIARVLSCIIIPELSFDMNFCVKRLEIIFFSEKGMEMLLFLTHLEITTLFKLFISVIRLLKISTEKFFKFLCIWLSCGVDYVEMTDLVTIYETYGYDDVLELLIHMDVIFDVSSYRMALPYLICDVNCDKYVANIVVTKFYAKIGDIEEYYKLLEFRTPAQTERIIVYKYKEIFVCDFPELFDKIEKRWKELPTVPSLRELSRDSAKIRIIKKYGIKKCSLFYSILKSLPIPKEIEDILSFKVPVNIFSDQ